jgi:hypothetical protein
VPVPSKPQVVSPAADSTAGRNIHLCWLPLPPHKTETTTVAAVAAANKEEEAEEEEEEVG